MSRSGGLCTCGHERHEHDEFGCRRGSCQFSCEAYSPRPGYARTSSFADLPVSQGARDLYERYVRNLQRWGMGHKDETPLDVLAQAKPQDVTNLLWARRTGKL